MPKVCVIVVNWNTRELLSRCLCSIAGGSEHTDVETVVVDNASSDGSAAMVRASFPGARLITNDANVGFARANNQAASSCDAAYLLLLNSDAELGAHSIDALLEVAEAHPRAAAVGPRISNPDGSFQSSYIRFPGFTQELLILSGVGRLLYGPWYPSGGPERTTARQVDGWLPGACMLLRRQAFLDVGGLDENYFMYAEEMDLCYRLRLNGWEIWHVPAATAVHLGSASSSRRLEEREADLYCGRVRFFRKHYGNGAAALLKGTIYAATALKILAHGVARHASRGRYGRVVVPLRLLATHLRKA